MDMDTVVAYVAFALALAALVLGFVAPRTKTDKDDKALEIVKEGTKLFPYTPKEKAKEPEAK